ncbi:hypothetical protein KUTeg_013231 [Tegillarca granosa]|uniref:Uncharacterized protein n=1 Tax=Tegillarca granosa TaxID=220873 RepID=A0ABQ9EWJ8_TEGGR|nr:hypothetical protein KUTeg_013231 [Tegillarca granosa]
MNSQNGSICSYDMSTVRSTDSRVSRISHDIDPRRFSACYPSTTGTMLSLHSNRPFSWHSESFDLDAQLHAASIHRDSTVPTSVDNHYSVPQNLDNFLNPTSSWAQAIANTLQFRPGMDRYSPELVASHHMIPPKISSGGHNSTVDRNISPKPLKETIVSLALVNEDVLESVLGSGCL